MASDDHGHPVIGGDGFVIRPASADDLDLLSAWFADPDVFRWWGGRPLDRDVVAAKYTGARCPRVESHVIELAERPIGYIQYHRDGPGDAGLDMMLLPAFRDRGLGPRAARVMASHLRSNFGWTISVDPAQHNPRAIRAWEKAGFVAEREWPDHPDGPALLMWFDG